MSWVQGGDFSLLMLGLTIGYTATHSRDSFLLNLLMAGPLHRQFIYSARESFMVKSPWMRENNQKDPGPPMYSVELASIGLL